MIWYVCVLCMCCWWGWWLICMLCWLVVVWCVWVICIGCYVCRCWCVWENILILCWNCNCSCMLWVCCIWRLLVLCMMSWKVFVFWLRCVGVYRLMNGVVWSKMWVVYLLLIWRIMNCVCCLDKWFVIVCDLVGFCWVLLFDGVMVGDECCWVCNWCDCFKVRIYCG